MGRNNRMKSSKDYSILEAIHCTVLGKDTRVGATGRPQKCIQDGVAIHVRSGTEDGMHYEGRPDRNTSKSHPQGNRSRISGIQ
jgi:hypothetical protein